MEQVDEGGRSGGTRGARFRFRRRALVWTSVLTGAALVLQWATPVAVLTFVADALAALLRGVADRMGLLVWGLVVVLFVLSSVQWLRRGVRRASRQRLTEEIRRSYREDVIQGVHWRWDWDYDDVIWLKAHCVECDVPLEFRDAAKHGGTWAYDHHCPKCDQRVEYDAPEAGVRQRVEAEIRRRGLSGEYKQAATTGAAPI